MKKLLLTVGFVLISFLTFSQKLDVFQPKSTGSYGFNKWPFTQSKYLTGFLEHVPEGLEGKTTTCIIDAHGVGFKKHDPTTLNEGLAKYIRNLDGDLTNPITGKKYVAIMPAGGEWVQHQEWANLIAYAMHHPNVDRIVITGLSGGAMRVLSLLMDSNYKNYVEVLNGAVAFSGKAVMRDVDQLNEVPLLAFHGLNDGVIKPGNIVSLRKKAEDNMILNLFNVGHNTWDAGWNDGFHNKPLQSFKGWDSDPKMSVWEFLKIIDETDSKIIKTPVECDVEVYIEGKFTGCMVYDRPYSLNDSTVLLVKSRKLK